MHATFCKVQAFLNKTLLFFFSIFPFFPFSKFPLRTRFGRRDFPYIEKATLLSTNRREIGPSRGGGRSGSRKSRLAAGKQLFGNPDGRGPNPADPGRPDRQQDCTLVTSKRRRTVLGNKMIGTTTHGDIILCNLHRAMFPIIGASMKCCVIMA